MMLVIQAVNRDTMECVTYRYNNVNSTEKYIDRHNNDEEFVASYSLEPGTSEGMGDLKFTTAGDYMGEQYVYPGTDCQE